MGSTKVSALMALVLVACGSGPQPAARPAAPITVTPAPPSPRRTPVPPRLIETVDTPVGDLRVAVHAGELFDGRRCWTFITDGLIRRDHPELVVSILLRDGDDPARYPTDVIEYLGQLGLHVPARQRFDPWNSATISVGLFGRDDVIGIAAIPAEGPAGLALPDPAVTLMPLTRDETEVASRYGAARVAAMLGKQERYYPAVWWFDRDRASLVTAADVGRSALAAMPGKRWSGITFLLDLASPRTFDDAFLRVRVMPSAVPELVQLLRSAGPGGGGALLLLGPDPLGGTRLVWRPGDRTPDGIFGPPSRRVTGNHLMLGVGGTRSGSQILEDGVIVRMTHAERDALVTALEAGRDHRSPTTDGPFAIEVVREPSPTRPLSMITYLAPPIDDLPARLAVGDMVLFTDEVERELIASLPAPRDLRQVEVRATLRPGKRDVAVTAVDGARDPWMAALERRIAALPEVMVADEVVVVLRFALTLSSPAAPARRP